MTILEIGQKRKIEHEKGKSNLLKGGIYISKKLAQKFSRQTITGWILETDADDSIIGKV